MTKELLIDAVGYVDESYLASFHQMDVELIKQRNVRKRKSIRAVLISAAALMLIIAMLTVSLPIAYICNYQEVNAYVSEAVDRVLFPLDNEDSNVNVEDLAINWVEWRIADQLFDALGAGTENSVIDAMKASENGLVGKALGKLGEFIEKLYEYYLKYKGERDETIGETESETETEAPKVDKDDTTEETTAEETTEEITTPDQETTEPESTLVSGNFDYEINPDGLTCTVTGLQSRVSDLIVPSHIEGIPVTAIGKNAFSNCRDLVSVQLPNSLTLIEESAFYACTKLEEIRFGDNLESIGNGAFHGCHSLRELDLPSGLRVIGADSLQFLESITELIIPEGVTTIGDRALYYNFNLEKLYLPVSLEKVGIIAVSGKEGLQIYYAGSVEQWNNIDKAIDDFANQDSFAHIVGDINCKDGVIHARMGEYTVEYFNAPDS